MLKSSLCDYSDANIIVKGTITVNNTAADGAAANNINKKVIFKNCVPFTVFPFAPKTVLHLITHK